MPRVNVVKHARKAIEGTDIKVGDTYYWWKFRFGGKQVSKTYPRRSQLTRSNYLSQMYDFEDNGYTGETKEDIAQSFRDLASAVEDLGSEQSDNRSNMPDALQDSETGELLQTRADRCEEIAQALNEAADELDSWEPEEPEEDTEGDEDTDEADREDEITAQVKEKADELWGEIDWSPE